MQAFFTPVNISFLILMSPLVLTSNHIIISVQFCFKLKLRVENSIYKFCDNGLIIGFVKVLVEVI
jgi:hypothetical protein